MEVLAIEEIDERTLLERVRQVRLVGHDGVRLYRDAELTLESVAPDALAPAQHYVLASTIARILALREALLARGHDAFALRGGVLVTTDADPERPRPLLPPIVEDSREPDGSIRPLICDGLHRVAAARALGRPIAVVRARSLPETYPYYAYACARGWEDVVTLDALPDGFVKKRYRVPDGYRALFRDFDAVFPGVQLERARTNPSHLRR